MQENRFFQQILRSTDIYDPTKWHMELPTKIHKALLDHAKA